MLKLQFSHLSLQIPLFLAHFHKVSVSKDKTQQLLSSSWHIYCVINQKLWLLDQKFNLHDYAQLQCESKSTSISCTLEHFGLIWFSVFLSGRQVNMHQMLKKIEKKCLFRIFLENHTKPGNALRELSHITSDFWVVW